MSEPKKPLKILLVSFLTLILTVSSVFSSCLVSADPLLGALNFNPPQPTQAFQPALSRITLRAPLVAPKTHIGDFFRQVPFVWGLDLSQSLQGAGGLLTKAESATTHAYLFDANGNVGQLVNTATGSVDAQYEYDPYGNTLVAAGTQAAGNAFRFSTKYLDSESNLYYYGFR